MKKRRSLACVCKSTALIQWWDLGVDRLIWRTGAAHGKGLNRCQARSRSSAHALKTSHATRIFSRYRTGWGSCRRRSWRGALIANRPVRGRRTPPHRNAGRGAATGRTRWLSSRSTELRRSTAAAPAGWNAPPLLGCRPDQLRADSERNPTAPAGSRCRPEPPFAGVERNSRSLGAVIPTLGRGARSPPGRRDPPGKRLAGKRPLLQAHEADHRNSAPCWRCRVIQVTRWPRCPCCRVAGQGGRGQEALQRPSRFSWYWRAALTSPQVCAAVLRLISALGESTSASSRSVQHPFTSSRGARPDCGCPRSPISSLTAKQSLRSGLPGNARPPIADHSQSGRPAGRAVGEALHGGFADAAAATFQAPAAG